MRVHDTFIDDQIILKILIWIMTRNKLYITKKKYNTGDIVFI